MRGALAILLCGLGGLLASCAQIELSPVGNPERVVVGTVDTGREGALPADAVVVVRVVDASNPAAPPQVLGSQTIRSPGVAPIAFRVEYRAEDDLLRQGLNIEARVSYDGRVQFYNVSKHLLALSNATQPHRVAVVPIHS